MQRMNVQDENVPPAEISSPFRKTDFQDKRIGDGVKVQAVQVQDHDLCAMVDHQINREQASASLLSDRKFFTNKLLAQILKKLLLSMWSFQATMVL